MKKFLILMCPLFFLSCYGQATSGIEKIDVEKFAKAIQGDVQLVDVRTKQEFSQGHIPKALNIDALSNNFKSDILKLDKERPVYIYCRSGQRSESAAREMHELGFKHVYDLEGGISSWDGDLTNK